MLMAIATVCFCGCSTGIEGTKTIKMTKGDRKAMTPSEEQTFASDIHGIPLKDWEKGRKFMASSDRTSLIFEPNDRPESTEGASMEGTVLQYMGAVTRPTPDLGEECVIIFTDGTKDYRFPTGKSLNEARQETDSSKLPLLTDIDLVEEWREKLYGKNLWTRSNLWYDEDGHRTDGLKYAEVKVIEVLPSTGDFPMKIQITEPGGKTAYMHMNYTSEAADSRSFSAIFLLSDPKKRYPQISPENWALIQQGKIGLGMTKEECRLSLGNPDDLNSGHNTAQTMDIWKYGDGTYLIFTDGVLTRFRQ